MKSCCIFVLTVTALYFVSCVATKLCLPKEHYQHRLDEFVSDVRTTNTHPSVIECIHGAGTSFKPSSTKLPAGRDIECYEDDIVNQNLMEIWKMCTTIVDAKALRNIDSSLKEETEETESHECNSCWSGCHYCCVFHTRQRSRCVSNYCEGYPLICL